MNEAALFRRRFLAVWRGPNWYGPTISAILEDLAHAVADQPGPNGSSSIARILVHMTGWINEVRRGLEGQPPVDPATWDWRKIEHLDGPRWEALKVAFDRACEELLGTVDGIEPSRLDSPALPEGPPWMTFRAVLDDIVSHTVHHGAQIARMKRT